MGREGMAGEPGFARFIRSLMQRRVLVAVILLRSLILLAGFTLMGYWELPPLKLGNAFSYFTINLLRYGEYTSNELGFPSQASRMPVLPVLYALSYKVSSSLGPLMIVKTVGVAAAFLTMLWNVWPRLNRGAVVVLSVLLLNPIVLRHVYTPYFEEFIVSDLIVLYSILFFIVWRRPGFAACSALAILASILYLTKMIFLPLIPLSLAVCLVAGRGLATKVGTTAILVSAVLFWGIHLHQAGGTQWVGTSWDGEDWFRATHPLAARLYPRISLDWLVLPDEQHWIDVNGEPLDLSPADYGARYLTSFASEWEWNSYYYSLSKGFVSSNPLGVARFILKKAWYVLVGLHDRFRLPGEPEHATPVLYLFLVLRACFFVALYYMVRGMDRKDQILFGVLASAMLAPLIIGFAYERHLGMGLSALSVAAIAGARKLQPGCGQEDGRPPPVSGQI
jgi:hypothetical protein